MGVLFDAYSVGIIMAFVPRVPASPSPWAIMFVSFGDFGKISEFATVG
jgi:hypothetical protein